MAFTKYASLDAATVLDVKGTPTRQRTASLDKVADYHNYRTGDGYMYVRMRAISSRVNKNNDGWPTVELAGSPELFERHQSSDGGGFTIEASEGGEYGFATFMGKPHFVDHHNSDPKRARGVVVDAKFHMLGNSREAALDEYYSSDEVDAEHLPPCEVELLIEVDAKSFPKLAQAIQNGDIDGFSMGCFVAGTPITLNDGTQKPIEKIRVGDEVLTHTGLIESVTSVMARHYTGTTYTIDTYGQATSMTLTEEHPVWTKRGWVEAKDLQKGDYVLTPQFKTAGMDVAPATALLTGWYLAEGNLGYDKKRYPDGRPVFVEWNLSIEEKGYVSDIQAALRELGYTPVGPYVKNNCATVRCNSPELASWFLATAGQHSWAKKLAPQVLHWNSTSQKILLDAYFNGDGHSRQDNKVEVGTASKDLAHQVQALCTRVGYRMTPPTRQHSPSSAAKRPKYAMNVTTTNRSSQGRFYLDESGLWRAITGITSQSHDDAVYNFDVGGDDSYVAADIAVHNCDVEKSKCSHCGNEATSPDEYCSHIVMKGAQMKVESGKHKGKSRKSYENCYGIKFFEISAVFDPADETALTKEVRSSVHKEGNLPARMEGGDPNCGHNDQSIDHTGAVVCNECGARWIEPTAEDYQGLEGIRNLPVTDPRGRHGSTRLGENPLPQSDHTTAPAEVDTLRQEQVCPVCGSDMDKETCDVCGFVEPPKHFDNPNLEKAKLRDEALEMGGGQTTVPEDADTENGAPAQGATQPGSFLQAEKAKKSGPPAGVMSSMRWEPKLNPKVAGKINQIERPVRPVSRPVTDEPNETVTSDPGHPVTSAFRTAQDMIQAAKRNQGEQMSTRVADAASGAPAVATPDKRVDVTGVGGVMEDSNDAASHADAQVNVMGTGGTGVEGVEADEHMTLPTASPDSNDSGFNHDKTTDDSGHTKTWGDGKGKFKQKSPVTTEHPYWVNENKWSSLSPEQRTAITLIAGDDKVWPPDEISGGSANQGVQPVDPVGKADKRVDVLEHVTSPANNSGPTKQWTGTGGNGVTRQQDPVTGDVIKSNGFPVGGQSMISAHMVTAMKLADTEIELGMLDKEYKYARIAELENWDTNVLRASLTAYTKVKTAGLNKTAAKSPMRLPSFKRATAAVDTQAPEPVDESDLDSALFSR